MLQSLIDTLDKTVDTDTGGDYTSDWNNIIPNYARVEGIVIPKPVEIS